MTQYLSVEEVQRMNERVTKGPSRGQLLNPQALRSAVVECQQGGFGQDFHPTLEEKAATILRGVAINHAFMDGNKRTALMATEVFLLLNGKELAADPRLEDFVVEVAQGQHDLASITERVSEMTIPVVVREPVAWDRPEHHTVSL